MSTVHAPEPDVLALRPFVPASDFEKSLAFYTDLGFEPQRFGEALAALQLGSFSFLLQAFEAEGLAGNFMMQMLVADLTGWWTRIVALDLQGRYEVRPPRPPALQSWGMNVAFLSDPSGVLWHIAQASAT